MDDKLMLPSEISEIAKNVSVEKKNEVQGVLNHVFNGVSKMREQLDSVIVVDENDYVSMKLANTIRLGVRQIRLDAEKLFDAKRADVQQKMISYKTEDQLWLKAKQTMQILTKEIEENARWKEETKQRYDAERKESLIQHRLLRLSKVAPEISRMEIENMGNETFETFFEGIKKAYDDKIEAEKKAERERIKKEKAEAEERERIRIENEQLKAEKAKADAEKKAIEEKARKEAEEAARKLNAEKEAARIAAQKARKEAEEAARKLNAEKEAARIAAQKATAEKEKLEAELKAKADAENRARKDAERKMIAEQKSKEDAERKAKNAPDKNKLIELSIQIDSLMLPDLKGDDANKILSDVKVLLGKISSFIREKSITL